MTFRIYSYSKFLPKLYLWTTKLIGTEKRKEIESTADLPHYLSVIRTTRVSSYIPMTADPFIIEISIKKFYKDEINTLLSMLPKGDIKQMRRLLFHEYIKELFYIFRYITRRDISALRLIYEAMLTISPSFIDEALSLYDKHTPQSVDYLKMLIEKVENKEYRESLGKEIGVLESINDIALFEVYMYLRALDKTKEMFVKSRFSVNPNKILCPYIDLEIARSASLLILATESLPSEFKSLPALGCFGLDLSSLEMEGRKAEQLRQKIFEVYEKIASFYEISIEQPKSINELDIMLGDALRSIMLKYAQKTFVTYPFTLSLPLSLFVLLFEERNFLLRNLSRVVFI